MPHPVVWCLRGFAFLGGQVECLTVGVPCAGFVVVPKGVMAWHRPPVGVGLGDKRHARPVGLLLVALVLGLLGRLLVGVLDSLKGFLGVLEPVNHEARRVCRACFACLRC